MNPVAAKGSVLFFSALLRTERLRRGTRQGAVLAASRTYTACANKRFVEQVRDVHLTNRVAAADVVRQGTGHPARLPLQIDAVPAPFRSNHPAIERARSQWSLQMRPAAARRAAQLVVAGSIAAGCQRVQLQRADSTDRRNTL
ncbi:hypothetical protein [Lentzea pudingi]|nr:hypothetical protein [Lentzea pudingi]